MYGTMDGPRGTVHSATDGPGVLSVVTMDGPGGWGTNYWGDHPLCDRPHRRWILGCENSIHGFTILCIIRTHGIYVRLASWAWFSIERFKTVAKRCLYSPVRI